jgi:hypothetical protein
MFTDIQTHFPTWIAWGNGNSKKESYTHIHGTQGMPTTHIDMTDDNKGKISAYTIKNINK